MTPLPEMLEWVRSHGNKLRRKGYEPPNHLANGTVRFFGLEQSLGDIKLDACGNAPSYTMTTTPTRVEIYGGNGDLLFSEDAA